MKPKYAINALRMREPNILFTIDKSEFMERNKMDKNTTMENLATALQEKDGFNGAWLYAENGEIVSKGALGFRNPENTLPITEDTIFQLASITKQFTATAVMLLRNSRLF